MNNRVLELLKNPKIIQPEDLNLLKEEINSFPYIQNIRALHLYGVHLFDKENYQKDLSTTAAYTTDKKILYQLINGKPQPKQEIQTKEIPVEDIKETENILPQEEKPAKHDYEAVSESLITPKAEIKTVIVNGERNRILYEGEENFLNEENSEKIDLESTIESGVIVTQKAESSPISSSTEEIIIDKKEEQLSEENKTEKKDSEKFNENSTTEDLDIETVIDESTINSEKVSEEIDNEAETSFIETEPFEPQKKNVEDVEEIHVEKEEAQEPLNAETIVDEDKIESLKVEEEIQDDSQLSFHGTESFFPNVKIETAQPNQEVKTEEKKPSANKYEDEMRRLIEEVEKKMKSQKKTETETDKEESILHSGNEISFSETQDFVVDFSPKEEKEDVIEEPSTEEISSDSNKIDEEPIANTSWKPMNIESSLPDSLIDKKESQEKTVEKIIPEEKTSEIAPNESIEAEQPPISNEAKEKMAEEEKNLDEKETETEVPVMNVSFFGSEISSLPINNKKNAEESVALKEEPLKEESVKKTESVDSNIPGFINTWQSWLKIDRTEEILKEKTATKNKAIESFIENNPKISQLKDEVSFTVKEKTDDISHLMTETLANLYIEQKLYTKAINAFQALIQKHPARKDYFEGKIQEIKDSRGKN